MSLRKHNFPPQFWIQLHKYTKDPLPPPAPRQPRPSAKNKIDKCLTSISPYVQKLIYTGAIDKRKGAIRSSKLPLNPEQFTLIQKLGATRKYEPVLLLEQALQLTYDFQYKGYLRAIEHVQFRLQQQKPVIAGKNPILLLRIRFQQKAPVFSQ
ncbi:unnamed protein product [Rotaria sp. Silwood1]|nr:unnamed protein product [Rotaria sp. Silwood1]CAF4103817.1 unnamed protein product [Rotaria sp. Silwood1]CAF5074038.1 unnamed protein product [Rotaria sp. Silwood1]